MPPTNCQKQLWTPFESVPASLLGRFFKQNCDLRWNYSSPRVREAQSVQLMENGGHTVVVWFFGGRFFFPLVFRKSKWFRSVSFTCFLFSMFFYISQWTNGKQIRTDRSWLAVHVFWSYLPENEHIPWKLMAGRWNFLFKMVPFFWEHLHFPRCKTGVVSKKTCEIPPSNEIHTIESVMQFCNRSSADVKP